MMLVGQPFGFSPKHAYNPLPTDHQAAGERCGICQEKLVAGDIPALLTFATTDEVFTSIALVIHESCAYPESPAVTT